MKSRLVSAFSYLSLILLSQNIDASYSADLGTCAAWELSVANFRHARREAGPRTAKGVLEDVDILVRALEPWLVGLPAEKRTALRIQAAVFLARLDPDAEIPSPEVLIQNLSQAPIPVQALVPVPEIPRKEARRPTTAKAPREPSSRTAKKTHPVLPGLDELPKVTETRAKQIIEFAATSTDLEFLGLKPGATQKEIKNALREIWRNYHPDISGEERLPVHTRAATKTVMLRANKMATQLDEIKLRSDTDTYAKFDAKSYYSQRPVTPQMKTQVLQLRESLLNKLSHTKVQDSPIYFLSAAANELGKLCHRQFGNPNAQETLQFWRDAENLFSAFYQDDYFRQHLNLNSSHPAQILSRMAALLGETDARIRRDQNINYYAAREDLLDSTRRFSRYNGVDIDPGGNGQGFRVIAHRLESYAREFFLLDQVWTGPATVRPRVQGLRTILASRLASRGVGSGVLDFDSGVTVLRKILQAASLGRDPELFQSVTAELRLEVNSNDRLTTYQRQRLLEYLNRAKFGVEFESASIEFD